MIKEIEDGFRFLLSVSPKDTSKIDSYDWVSNLLKLKPTNTNKKGDVLSEKRNFFYTTWKWEYGTEWIPYWPSNRNKLFSDELLEFLQSLPSNKKVWEDLAKECDYCLYIPVEREYFLIEVEFEPTLWLELGNRNLRLELSALAREEKE